MRCALPFPSIHWTPNKVTALRVGIGFAAVTLFGRGPWPNLIAVALTVTCIALDALDGHIARRKNLASPFGAQIDILGDRMIENVYFTYFAVAGMVSLWLPVLFFARGAATDFLRGLAMRAGHSGWGAGAMLQASWTRALVGSQWSRGLYAAMKCLCRVTTSARAASIPSRAPCRGRSSAKCSITVPFVSLICATIARRSANNPALAS